MEATALPSGNYWLETLQVLKGTSEIECPIGQGHECYKERFFAVCTPLTEPNDILKEMINK